MVARKYASVKNADGKEIKGEKEQRGGDQMEVSNTRCAKYKIQCGNRMKKTTEGRKIARREEDVDSSG